MNINNTELNLHTKTSKQFTRYDDCSVCIDDCRYDSNILISDDQITPFKPITVATLTLTDLTEILQLNPELLLLGTGNKISYPNATIIASFSQKLIGLEVMTIPALCRTFNFLVADGRNIAALLLFQ